MGTWVLETKHGSSAWIACAPNHWSIFPAPPGISLHMLCFMICRSGREWFLERTREIFLCQLVSFFLKKKKKKLHLFVCACVCVHACVYVKGVCVWKARLWQSEDNLGELFFSFYHIGLRGVWTQTFSLGNKSLYSLDHGALTFSNLFHMIILMPLSPCFPVLSQFFKNNFRMRKYCLI